MAQRFKLVSWCGTFQNNIYEDFQNMKNITWLHSFLNVERVNTKKNKKTLNTLQISKLYETMISPHNLYRITLHMPKTHYLTVTHTHNMMSLCF